MFSSILVLIGHMVVSHLRDKTGVLLSAPVAILSAVFWITSNLLIRVVHAEP